MKSCYGNYMIDNICKGHNGCRDGENCFVQTSVSKGKCHCEFKKLCHLHRQDAQIYKKEVSPSSECFFYKEFMKDLENMLGGGQD